MTETEVAFNVGVTTYDHGNAFCLSLEEMHRGDLFFWNLVGDPHDIAVKVVLIRLVSYFPEIEVGSDREPSEWWEAALRCQKLFGVADLPPGSWGDRGKLGEDARRQLIALAISLPDALSV
ncbi:hypothetical protein [Ktedonobacter robiniae]|uniref:Uncharacterized protein n=1 Tax=Ktedonobacter robiniae TaxID=2778365 RepID=A0ABQ3V1I9_9CHLR|nr:hypothetical protein [Ktedonobacter robiniae]GHO59006.1 hypothetical protein KSB_74810 [Ktedonobacter robiniae]